MSVKYVLKLLLALGAAVLLPMGLVLQTDHYSGARRSKWSWAGLPVTDWQVEENARSRWVRDVLNLPPDYFDGVIGGPVWLAGYIGALPRNILDTRVYLELWENVPAVDKSDVRIEALRCLLEPDWREREQMRVEAVKRWQKS